MIDIFGIEIELKILIGAAVLLLIISAALIFLLMNKRKKKKTGNLTERQERRIHEQEEEKKERDAEALYTDRIMPIVAWDEEYNVGVMYDGTIVDVLGVISKNLASASDSDVAFDIACWDKLYKTYPGDLKIIGFNFPTNTDEQQEYFRHLLKRTRNPVYREQLTIRLSELEYISDKRKDREYAILFYAKDLDDYKKQLLQIYTQLSTSITPLATKLPAEKKKQIVMNLYNKCVAL